MMQVIVRAYFKLENLVYHENELMQASWQVQGSNCRIFLMLVSQ